MSSFFQTNTSSPYKLTKRYTYLFITFILSFLFTLSTYAQTDHTAFSNSLKALFELNFDKAEVEAKKVINAKERAYLNHYRLFISKMISNHTITDYPNIFESISDTLLNTNNPHNSSLAYLSELHLQKGIIDYSNNNKWSAIRSFAKAYGYWQKSEKKHPKLIQNLKLKGIFNLLMANLPDPYATWAKWFGYTGDFDIGFFALEQYFTHKKEDPGYRQEAILFLGFAYLKFAIDEPQIKAFIKKETTTSQPPLIQSLLIRCAFKIRNPHLCHKWLTNAKDSHYIQLVYLKGKYAYLQENTETPDILNKFVSHNNGNLFKADAIRYLSWYYLLQGDTVLYLLHQQTIKTLKQFPTWEDKQAKYESQLEGLPNIILLKSRLLFDRGDYFEAQQILLKNQSQFTFDKKLKIEFYYRLGRCYQLLNNTQLAEENYILCINFSIESKRYFGPYAAIYAAQIKANKNLNEEANYYLREARRLNDGEYKSDAQQKIQLLSEQLEKRDTH